MKKSRIAHNFFPGRNFGGNGDSEHAGKNRGVRIGEAFLLFANYVLCSLPPEIAITTEYKTTTSPSQKCYIFLGKCYMIHT